MERTTGRGRRIARPTGDCCRRLANSRSRSAAISPASNGPRRWPASFMKRSHMFGSDFLSLAVVVPAAAVIVAMFIVLWRERRSSREGLIALASGVVLALWLVAEIALARKGFFVQAAGASGPPGVGINLVVVLLALAFFLGISPSLRALLSRQSTLIRLHLWRFEGALFLILMAQGRLPALFALPAGIGDILVAATAPW